MKENQGLKYKKCAKLVKRWWRQRTVVSAFTNEQVSRARLFTKEKEQRNERTLIFAKKIRASDIKLALAWSR